jgi:O-antigen/teichoic acid export membrane protein
MGSLKKNVVWSSILTTANYIFPLITFPYISRVLGVEKVGICNFVDGVINYYCIFAMMGISYIAIREVARTKNDRNKLSETFASLLTLNLISTTIVASILVASIFIVPKFQENANLMFIGVSKLIFNTFLIEWLYTGLEKFDYITKRSIVVRCFYVVCVFLFVKDTEDYNIYYLLLTLTIVINAIINSLHARQYITFSQMKINIKPFIKPFFILGIYAFLTSLYKTFNTVYLGFMGGDVEVGFYSTATKLHSIIIALFTAFTSVMMPRMAALVSEGDDEAFNELYEKSIKILFAFSIPLICFSIIFADQIVLWVSGAGYEGAVPCMQIVMPLVFIIGYEQILVFQILMPLRKDKCIFINSIIGAVAGLTLNLLLVPILKSRGSSIVWLFSELSVLILAQFFVKKYTNVSFPFKMIGRYILISTPIIAGLLLLHYFNPIGDYTLLLGVLITFFYFAFIELSVMKNEVILSSIKLISSKINIKSKH